MQQIDRAGEVKEPQVAQDQQQEHRAHHFHRFRQGGDGDAEAQWNVELQQPKQPHQRQLGKQDARAKAQHDAQHGQKKGFQDQHMADLPLFHAEDVVQPQLLLAALHNEAVGVDEDAQHHQRQHKGTHGQHEADGGGAALHDLSIGQVADDV